MKVFRGAAKISKKLKSPVLTIGNFDGVHTGHATILKKVVQSAKKVSGTPVVYTFSPHPAKAVSKVATLKLIQTEEQKLLALEKEKIGAVIVEPFSQKFSTMSPDDFFKKIIVGKIAPVKIIVGYDLTFGRHRKGTTETLQSLCEKHGIEFEVVPVQLSREIIISSTQIREFIEGGKIKEANKLLGRPFAISGPVIKGFGRGARMEIPTANISSENELIPAPGVYATKVQNHAAVTNIGFNPTFGGNPLSIETHILNFKKNLYGKKITVEFIDKIRNEAKFANPRLLKRQILKDIAAAKKISARSKK